MGMFYAIIGILAVIIHLIINYDILLGREWQNMPSSREYKLFQYSVIAYYLTDIIWGLLYKTGHDTLIYTDTLAYYVSLSFSVLFWCKYVVSYLELGNRIGKALNICAILFFVSEMIALVVNLFTPFFFHFDEEGNFSTGILRLVVFVIQMIMFVVVAIPSFITSFRNTSETRSRGFTVSVCSLFMVVMGFIQTKFPLIPLYAIGLLIATCLLHVYVHEAEKISEMKMQQILAENIAANKAKTIFLQNMSHEIRTPLNAMFGFAQLLGLPDGSWTQEEKDQYNSYIFNSYNMLDMLIGDIIDISDSENGSYRIESGSVNINTVCRNAIMSVEYRKQEGVDMHFTTDISDDFTLVSDGRRIQQVLTNFLTNACKNTMEGSIHLHCSGSEKPGHITLSVADTGPGIPADKAEEIFQRFTKLNDFVQGSGLGLNICRMIASKLNAEVYLDQTYTNGARFVMELKINDATEI